MGNQQGGSLADVILRYIGRISYMAANIHEVSSKTLCTILDIHIMKEKIK